MSRFEKKELKTFVLIAMLALIIIHRCHYHDDFTIILIMIIIMIDVIIADQQ